MSTDRRRQLNTSDRMRSIFWLDGGATSHSIKEFGLTIVSDAAIDGEQGVSTDFVQSAFRLTKNNGMHPISPKGNLTEQRRANQPESRRRPGYSKVLSEYFLHPEIIGLEVSRDWIEIHCLTDRLQFRLPNTDDSHSEHEGVASGWGCFGLLQGHGRPGMVVTGELGSGGIQGRHLPPAQVKAFGISRGTLVKTDRGDAELISPSWRSAQRQERPIRGDPRRSDLIPQCQDCCIVSKILDNSLSASCSGVARALRSCPG